MLILALFCISAKAQVPVNLAPTVHIQFTDGTGKLLSGGFLYTYSAGTTTRLDTYTDGTGTITNAWPIPLDATGSPSNGSTQTGIWISSAAYKFCAYNSALVQQWCTDNIIGPPFLAGNNNWTGNQTFAGTSTFNAAVILAAGGSLAGSFSGSPNFSGNVTFGGNPVFLGSPNFVSATPVWYNALQSNLNANFQSNSIANNSSGTIALSLVTLTGAPATATTPTTSATGGVVGICLFNCGNTGTATVQNNGFISCNFDSTPVVAGDYVQISPSVAGDCHDIGNSYPSAGQVIGRAMASGSGQISIDLFPAEIRSPNANVNYPNVVYNTASASTSTNIGAVTMLTVGTSSATYRFQTYIQLSGVGASCTGSPPTDVQVALIFQDPLASGASTFNSQIYPVPTQAAPNGVLGPSGYWTDSWATTWNLSSSPVTFRAKTGTVIQYSATYTLGGGCSPGPSYTVFPILEQLTAN